MKAFSISRRAVLRGAGFATLLGLTLGACSAPNSVSIPPDTQLIMVRHADRTGEELNARGHERARALVDALDGVQIDAIYSPGIKRNLDTAAPLSGARGIEVTRIPPTGTAARLMAENRGRTVVWIGNKGNIAEIWEALSAPGEAPLNYGDLFFLRRGPFGQVIVTRQFFGPQP